MDEKKKVDLSKIASDLEQVRRMSEELMGQNSADSVWPDDFDASGGGKPINVTRTSIDLFEG